jgi:hypothetical protein
MNEASQNVGFGGASQTRPSVGQLLEAPTRGLLARLPRQQESHTPRIDEVEPQGEAEGHVDCIVDSNAKVAYLPWFLATAMAVDLVESIDTDEHSAAGRPLAL